MIHLSMEFPQGGRELADTRRQIVPPLPCTGLSCVLEKRGCEKGGGIGSVGGIQ